MMMRAGVAYFALAFAAGFALGVVRTLVLEPRFGAWPALALELPVMLALSWIACAWAIRRFDVPATVSARLGMGTMAFALLMLAEFALALALGESPAGYLTQLTSPLGLAGVAAQFAFALFPLIRARRWDR
jgi:hypothetical protein